MNSLLTSFSNREIATAIWLMPISAFVISSANVRSAIGNLIGIMLKRQMVTVTGLMVGNTILSVYILERLNIWDPSLLKDTIFWFLFSGFYLVVYAATDSDTEEKSFRRVVFENFKAVALIEFFVNFYTFSVTTELLLFPVMLFITVMGAVAKTDNKFDIVAKAMDWLLGLAGTALLIYSVHAMISRSFDILGATAQKQFLIYPLLTLMFLPLLFALALYSSYERLFCRMNFAFRQNPELNKVLKRHVILKCKFGLNRIKRVSGRLNDVWGAQTLDDAKSFLEDGHTKNPSEGKR